MYRIFCRMAVIISAISIISGCEKTEESTTPVESAENVETNSLDLSTDDSNNLPVFPSNPKDFVSEVTNPYLGFKRGKVFIYEGETEDGFEKIIVEVTNDTKTIIGVKTTVVHDRAFLDGDLIEDTFDWYAQDKDGNVWYFGEDVKNIEDGVVVNTDGSWKAGVKGAKPGIIMLAKPKVGVQYQQEFATGVAEDMARILSLSEKVKVPFGMFKDCLKTLEFLCSGSRPGIRNSAR